MTLDQLRIFVAVASVEHITRGAEKLNLSQSAVSAAIRALEMRYGVDLFDRVGRSIVLNQAGRQFLIEARKVLASAAAAEAAIADLGSLRKGELSIMASNTIVSNWLPRRLAAYRGRYPGVRLLTSMGNTSDVTAAVKAGVVEIGLIEWPTEESGVAATHIDEDEMIVIVPSEHRWAAKEVQVQDLTETSWVLREQGSGTRRAFDTLLERYGTTRAAVEIALELPDNAAVVDAVRHGVGATLISRSAAEALIRSGAVVQAPLSTIPRPYFLIRNPERYHSGPARAFERMALNEC